jgi:hypothetical protein
MAASIRLAEHKNKGHNEKLIAPLVADMQNPVTPIIEAAFAGERFHNTRRMIPRLSEIVHYGAVIIDQNLLRVGAVEIYLGHVQPRSNATPTGNNEALASELSSTGRPEDGSGDAVMI